jgi:hypothetical protein
MNLGMLWFDNDPKVDLQTKVDQAATYYRNKYGKTANVCFVHPTMLAGQRAEDGDEDRYITGSGVEIRSNRSVMPNHFWIGIKS